MKTFLLSRSSFQHPRVGQANFVVRGPAIARSYGIRTQDTHRVPWDSRSPTTAGSDLGPPELGVAGARFFSHASGQPATPLNSCTKETVMAIVVAHSPWAHAHGYTPEPLPGQERRSKTQMKAFLLSRPSFQHPSHGVATPAVVGAPRAVSRRYLPTV